jgi:peptide/nickel transport system permease protein
MTAIVLTSDDRLAQATQLQLTWWRFRRHKLAVVSLVIVALFYLGAVFADFLAVVDPHATDARRSFIPPQMISLFDNGAFAPHVSGLKGVRDPKPSSWSTRRTRRANCPSRCSCMAIPTICSA